MIDVAAFVQDGPAAEEAGAGAVTTESPKVWAPPTADGVLPAVFLDTFEVRVLSTDT